MKAKKIGAILLASVMAVSMVPAMSVSAADAKRVCFVARASSDTFAAWLTTEMKKQAEKYDDIELTCVSGEGDDNKENGLLEDCITKQYDLVIVQSNNNGAQAPYVQQLVDAGIPVIIVDRMVDVHIRMIWMVEMILLLWQERVLLMQIQSSRQKSVQQEL